MNKPHEDPNCKCKACEEWVRQGWQPNPQPETDICRCGWSEPSGAIHNCRSSAQDKT